MSRLPEHSRHPPDPHSLPAAGGKERIAGGTQAEPAAALDFRLAAQTARTDRRPAAGARRARHGADPAWRKPAEDRPSASSTKPKACSCARLPFVPQDEARTFHIAAPDYLDTQFLPKWSPGCAANRRNSRLVIHTLGPRRRLYAPAVGRRPRPGDRQLGRAARSTCICPSCSTTLSSA